MASAALVTEQRDGKDEQPAAAPTEVEAPQPAIPDLLYKEGTLRIDAEGLREDLPFAFVSGDSSGAIENALTDMPVGDSGWNPDVFAHELFLDELIDMCMRATHDGFEAPINHTALKRMISSPPRQRADVDFRREALTELWDNSLLRSHLNRAYRKLCQMIVLFDSQGYSSRYDDLERRLEIIATIRSVIAQLAAAPDVGVEAIDRIRDFASGVAAGEAFQQLAEFIDYKDNLASVELRLGVRLDGKLGSFEVQRVTENKNNRFYQAPWLRLLRKIFLFLRGYRFSEMEIVERWIDKVFTATLDFMPALFQLKADLEFYLAAIAFRDYCGARGLDVCLPSLSESSSAAVNVRQLFNPLLFSQEIIPICCDLATRNGESMAVITGPNSGGKTRLLQGIAIMQLLGQTGMYIPAKSAELRWCRGMFVSLVEAAKVDQEEGRLGTEMLRIRRVFEQAGDVSLVIIDELCSGTNPTEGEEIFHLVMTLLRKVRPQVFVTTHFLRFAERLEENNELELEFLQVELDAQNQPTFGFVPGVAHSSLAKETAARLGVTQDELLALIEAKTTDS